MPCHRQKENCFFWPPRRPPNRSQNQNRLDPNFPRSPSFISSSPFFLFYFLSLLLFLTGKGRGVKKKSGFEPSPACFRFHNRALFFLKVSMLRGPFGFGFWRSPENPKNITPCLFLT
jgi:hypothetical protein